MAADVVAGRAQVQHQMDFAMRLVQMCQEAAREAQRAQRAASSSARKQAGGGGPWAGKPFRLHSQGGTSAHPACAQLTTPLHCATSHPAAPSASSTTPFRRRGGAWRSSRAPTQTSGPRCGRPEKTCSALTSSTWPCWPSTASCSRSCASCGRSCARSAGGTRCSWSAAPRRWRWRFLPATGPAAAAGGSSGAAAAGAAAPPARATACAAAVAAVPRSWQVARSADESLEVPCCSWCSAALATHPLLWPTTLKGLIHYSCEQVVCSSTDIGSGATESAATRGSGMKEGAVSRQQTGG